MSGFTVKNVSMVYDGDLPTITLQDINLQVRDGEFLCILGPSGCGKSTLLELLAGLQLPTEGEIWLDDA
ncbi:ATP-binding cassette domain-containing protein, partial [Clostridium perfringens]